MTKINIPEDIYDRLQKRVDSTDEFNSVEEYVEYILKQVVERLNAQTKPSYSEEDEKKVKERLRSLGYLE